MARSLAAQRFFDPAPRDGTTLLGRMRRDLGNHGPSGRSVRPVLATMSATCATRPRVPDGRAARRGGAAAVRRERLRLSAGVRSMFLELGHSGSRERSVFWPAPLVGTLSCCMPPVPGSSESGHGPASGCVATRPGLQGTVVDLPHVRDSAVEAAKEAGVADRFTAVAGDFFKEVPGADLFLLKQILHDWDDESCLTILRNCRSAAKPGARAVVVESVVGGVGEPSFGALLGMNMVVAAEGQERGFEQFDALYAATGWRRVSTKPTRSPQFVQELEAI